MRIDKSLLNQQSAKAMTQENERPIFCILSLYPYCLQKFICLVDKSASIVSKDCGGIVLVEEYACVGYVFRKVVTEP